MRNLWKSVFGLCVIGMGLAVSAPAQAASANGPYYATPSWDQKLDANTRFIVLLNWNSEAVLDRETGLVWEQSPSITGGPANNGRRNWQNAQIHCNQKTVGNRKGWRLPTIQDLASLIDPTQSNPVLPSGHPFSNVQSSIYWSATTDASNSFLVWVVNFANGNVDAGFNKGNFFLAWCVRGGSGVDPK